MTGAERGVAGSITGADAHIDLQRAASELLPAAEYAKWQSSARTLFSDLPGDTSLDALAREIFGDLGPSTDESCPPTFRYCAWFARTNTYHPQPYQYWEIANKPYLWYMAQRILPPAEYVKWQQRLKFTPFVSQGLYVHNEPATCTGSCWRGTATPTGTGAQAFNSPMLLEQGTLTSSCILRG